MRLCHLVVVFTLIFLQASAFALHHRSPSVSLPENKLVVEEKEVNSKINNVAGGKDVVQHTTSAHSAGETSGRYHGNGEAGNGGESANPTTSGGSTASVIPIIGSAGAINNHHHGTHHGAANCNKGFVGFFSFTATIFSLLVLQVPVYWLKEPKQASYLKE